MCVWVRVYSVHVCVQYVFGSIAKWMPGKWKVAGLIPALETLDLLLFLWPKLTCIALGDLVSTGETAHLAVITGEVNIKVLSMICLRMGVVQVGLWVPTPSPWCSPTYGVIALPQVVFSALAHSACVSLGWHERLAVVRDFALCACVCVYIRWSLVGFDDGFLINSRTYSRTITTG